MKEVQLTDGSTKRKCVYTPHSLRATPVEENHLTWATVNVDDEEEVGPLRGARAP